MNLISKTFISLTVASVASTLMAGPAPGERISFVSCPIVRDTATVPCWLSEYEGDTYYLTIQSDVSASVQPPLLGHQVLVEGIVTDEPAICGGYVLEDIHLTAMPELDANCDTILPVDERYVIDFNPRPPGPSAGRLAFDRPPGTPVEEPEKLVGPQTFDIYFDFDKGVSFRHPRLLSQILAAAEEINPSRMTVTGVIGAHLLSDGTILEESANTGRRRAEEISRLLREAGIDADTDIGWTDALASADGIDDWRSRRVTVELIP